MQEFLDHVLGFFGYTRNIVAKPAAFGTTSEAAPLCQRATDKETLIGLLTDEDYEFRSLGALMKSIRSQNEDYTKTLLREVGARSSYRDESKWGLKSRVGETGRRYA